MECRVLVSVFGWILTEDSLSLPTKLDHLLHSEDRCWGLERRPVADWLFAVRTSTLGSG